MNEVVEGRGEGGGEGGVSMQDIVDIWIRRG